MIETLQNLDSLIFLFFNSSHCTFFDSFMSLYSGRFIWIPMYTALLVMMLRRYPLVKVICLIIGIALAITLADQICSSLIRPLCQRLRPSNLENPLSEFTHIVNNYRGGAYGFPSCHAANSFALAGFAATMLRNRGFSMFIIMWAILNSYSRIYLGVHYPGDLIVGGIIGAAAGILCCRAAIGTSAYIAKHQSVGQNRTVITQNISLPGVLNKLNLMEFVGIITILAIIFVSLSDVIG